MLCLIATQRLTRPWLASTSKTLCWTPPRFESSAVLFDACVMVRAARARVNAPWCGGCKKLATVWEELSDVNGSTSNMVSISRPCCSLVGRMGEGQCQDGRHTQRGRGHQHPRLPPLLCCLAQFFPVGKRTGASYAVCCVVPRVPFSHTLCRTAPTSSRSEGWSVEQRRQG